MGIDNHLKIIKEGVFGRDVRQAIHDGIEQTYDDATANGNANMEVAMARGTHPNLRSRLEEVDNKQQQTTAQLQQKAERDTVFSMANMGQDIKLAMTNGSVPVVDKGAILTENIVPRQITPLTTDFFDVVNFMDLSSASFVGEYVGVDGAYSTGNPLARCIVFRVEPNTIYKLKLDGVTTNRGNVIGNVENNFVIRNKYNLLAVNARIDDVITFSTNALTNWVCVYFTSEGKPLEYYESVKTRFKLYKNSVPISQFDTVKKVNLPKDILYAGEVKTGDTDFFSFYNLLEKYNYQKINGLCTVDGVVTIPANAEAMIVDAEPSTDYFIKLPTTNDRAFILSSSTDFGNGGTYDVLSTTNLNMGRTFEFTTNADTSKIFIYYHSTLFDYDISEFELVKNLSDFGKGTRLAEQFLPSVGNRYLDKKLLLIGDSITAIGLDERGWPKYFVDIIKPSSITNVAVSGATWTDKIGTVYDGNPVINGADNNVNNVIGNQIQKILNNPPEAPDIIMIAAGTNDAEYTMTDEQIEAEFYSGGAIVPLASANRLNFAGAMRYAVEKLRELYPDAQIFICTPLQRAEPSYPVIKTKGDLIKKIARRLSVPVIDSQESGVYGEYAIQGQATLDHNDGLHLSPTGAKKVGEYNARKVINWFCF